MGIVSSIASDLGLSRQTDPEKLDASWDAAWSVEYGERPRKTFTLSVTHTDTGYWTVGLLDWPAPERSKYSVNAERAMREALEDAAGVRAR